MGQLEADYEQVQGLVDRLLAAPELLPFPVPGAPRLVETHVSWVLLFGADVLKFRKPVHMGMIDCSTRTRRVYLAGEELRLNRQWSPELYLGLLRFVGSWDAPGLSGAGPLLEVAVHMRQFDSDGQFDEQLARGLLTARDMVLVAETMARIQASAPPAGEQDEWGRFEAVMAPVRENFVQTRAAACTWSDAGAETGRAALAQSLAVLEAHSEAWGEQLRPHFEARRRAGFVREGHGDLHLGNIARTPWGILAFDCIEFAPSLRWIDVVSELAFLSMDLTAGARTDLAWALVNAWATRTGDHAGLRLLPFYTLYRTLVCVKVAALRRSQVKDAADRAACDASLAAYLALAEQQLPGPSSPVLLLTCGVSGSGKSQLAASLAMQGGAVHLRSDVERKRLFGLPPEHRTDAAGRERLYARSATERTYALLADHAAVLLDAGVSVIVDATFLAAQQRTRFAELARTRALRGVLVECSASPATLRARITARAKENGDPSDADLAVLDAQLARQSAPGAEIADFTHVRVGEGDDTAGLVTRLAALMAGQDRPLAQNPGTSLDQ